MRVVRTIALMLAVLVALFGLSVLTAAAQGPVANLTPFNAPYIDNQSHQVPAGASVWYRFDYAVNPDTGARPVTTILLPNGFATGITFDVWTQNGIADVIDNTPVGRASPATVQMDGTSTQTADLKWVGAFGSGGSYYVRVSNPTMNNAAAQLMISGDGVLLAPIAVTGSTQPQSGASSSTTSSTTTQPGSSSSTTSSTATQPGSSSSTTSSTTTQPGSNSPTTSSTTAQPGANMDDPAKAVALDGKQQTIAANSAQWFSFNYTINTDVSANVHPVIQIRLLNGNVSGVGFEVYSPEILGDWWENKPLGNGTPTSTSSDGTVSQSPDLNWSGAFGASGTYYVRVLNNTANPLPATLTIQVID